MAVSLMSVARREDVHAVITDEGISDEEAAERISELAGGRITESDVRSYRRLTRPSFLRASPYADGTDPMPAAPPPVRRGKAIPEWAGTPGFEVDGDEGTIYTKPRPALRTAPDEGPADDEEQLREFGFDPAVWEVSWAKRSTWQAQNGDWLESRKLTVRKRDARRIHLENVNEVLAAYAVPGDSPKARSSSSRTMVLAMGDLQVGKALADETPVLTPGGWVRHGDLRPGHEVYGADGLPKRVLDVTGSTPQEMYAINFDRGTTLLASGDHLWQGLRRYHRSKKDQRWERRELLWSTRQIASHHGQPGRSFHVALPLPLASPAAILPVDPYLLGAWLGDGMTAKGVICGAPDDLKEILYGFDHAPQPSMTRPNCESHRISGLTGALGKLGVIGNKHVPAAYLHASEHQRRELLSGLLDTDGSISEKGRVEFTTVLPGLAKDARFLMSSLGYKARTTARPGRYKGRQCNLVYRVTFTPYDGKPLFRLTRKRDRQRTVFYRDEMKYRFVQSVVPAGQARAQCITVEGGVYLAGEDLVPTHNCDGGGSESLVARFGRITGEVASALRSAGGCERLIIVNAGDCIEGVVAQNGRLVTRLDLSVTEQVRLLQRMILHATGLFAPLCDKMLMVTVPGNHDEAHRVAAAKPSDSWAIQAASSVSDALSVMPGYEHVEWLFPGDEETAVTVSIGTKDHPYVLAVTHGHVCGSTPNSVLSWWKGQSHGRQPAGEADLLITGHWHHLRTEFTGGGRTWVQLPSMDGGSDWYRRKRGEEVAAGAVTLEVDPSRAPGWGNLRVWS